MVKYRLDDLGWYQFEWLCQSLLKSRHGLAVEAWGGHSDLGRDAYCETDLEFSEKGKRSKGPFVFQCKFVGEANAVGSDPGPALLKAVKSEATVMQKRFSSRGLAGLQQYVLLTNSPLDKALRNECASVIKKVVPKASFLVLGGPDIERILDDAPNIRVAFPQILGIADLTALLNSAILKPVLERSTLALQEAKELAQIFAPTEAYSRAVRVLNQHRFVVLSGPPEMGKTTIARMIGLAKLGEGWECFECRTPSDFFQAIDPEKAQVFIADDAFGRTGFKPEMAERWEADLPHILRRLSPRHWLIWTSRAAILHVALERMDIQGVSEKFPEPSEVIVDAAKLSTQERALILYRHCKAANLSKHQKDLIRKWAQRIIYPKHFTPERLRRFVTHRLKELARQIGNEDQEEQLMSQGIKDEIEEPTEGMRKSFRALSREHRALLISLLDVSVDPAPADLLVKVYRRHAPADARPLEKVASELSSHFIREQDGK